MPSPLSQLSRFRPPVRRVLALDGGNRRLKLLLAESDFGRLRLLKEELIDLQAEGLVAAEEVRAHLLALIQECGKPPLALILPEHLSISQVIDLPLVPESEVEKLIADETIKLSGVSESRIIYDFVRTEAPAKNRQQFWVTLCQEGNIRERIARLGVEHEDLCDVTTTANALIAAYRATCPLSSRAILVHLGAQTTVVVILLAGQGAFAASFQMGGDFFTRALARLEECSEESAESLKREKDLLKGPAFCPEFAAAVNGWVAELKRQVDEWFQANPKQAAEVSGFELVASGGGFEQPGLLEYLKTQAGLDLRPWPKGSRPDMAFPAPGFEVAFGAALQALGHSPQPVSLLPEDYRLSWQKRQVRQRIDLASVLLLLLCALALAFGTWRKLGLIRAKEALLNKVQASHEDLRANDSLSAVLVGEYENLRPIFAAQQNSIDVLKTLSLLQQSRSNRDLWYVLLADQQSYFSHPPALLSTNRPVKIGLLGSAIEPFRTTFTELRAAAASTNTPLAKPGLIAELCVPGQAETARQTLSDLVNTLKQQSIFSKVDLLSDDLRRNLAEPKVLVPDRSFVLALNFLETDFQQPVHPRRTLGALGASKRAPRPLFPASQPGDEYALPSQP